MKKPSKATIEVKGTEVTILRTEDGDFISLTDMLKAKDGDFFISDWLRNRNTVEFLGIWETVHNPHFNSGEFATIKSQAGLNSYKLSVKEWVEQTGAIGLRASAGRYGGTFAHRDIAFEFGMWISALLRNPPHSFAMPELPNAQTSFLPPIKEAATHLT
jgi:KilA-N domain